MSLSNMSTPFPNAAPSLVDFRCNTPHAQATSPQLMVSQPADSQGLSLVPPSCWTHDKLVDELERLLSRESIVSQNDPFITSLFMTTASLELPAVALASHPRLAPVTPLQLLQAAQVSKVLTANMEKQVIIPELQGKRSTLIIRDVDASVTVHDILSVLKESPDLQFVQTQSASDIQDPTDVSGICSNILSLSLVGNGCWFLTLDTEERTQKVAWWLRGQTLKGAVIQVRMKTESPLRVTLRLPYPGAATCVTPNASGNGSRLKWQQQKQTFSHNVSSERNKTVLQPRAPRSHTERPRTNSAPLCTFCRKQKKTNSASVEVEAQSATTPSDAPQKSTTGETRCLCHLLSERVRTTRPLKRNAGPRRRPAPTSADLSPEAEKTSSMTTTTWRDRRPGGPQRGSGKPPGFSADMPKRRPHGAPLKERVVPVVHSQESKKRSPPRLKVSVSRKPRPITSDFPPLFDEPTVNVAVSSQDKKNLRPETSAISLEQPLHKPIHVAEASETGGASTASPEIVTEPNTVISRGDSSSDLLKPSGTMDTANQSITRGSDSTTTTQDAGTPQSSESQERTERQGWNAQAFWAQKTQRHKAVMKLKHKNAVDECPQKKTDIGCIADQVPSPNTENVCKSTTSGPDVTESKQHSQENNGETVATASAATSDDQCKNNGHCSPTNSTGDNNANPQ